MVHFDASLLCADNDKGDDKQDDKQDDQNAKIAELEAKIEGMVIAKKKRKSKWMEVHEGMCAAVNPLLPSIKELDYFSLFWLSRHMARYKKGLAKKNPDVVAAYKCYTVWYHRAKKLPDFDADDVSEDAEAGAEVEESDDDEAGAEVEESDDDNED